METLIELSKFCQSQIKIIDILLPEKANSPLTRLKNIVFSSVPESDYNAMIEIYGMEKLSAFSKLKTRLSDILIRSIIIQNSAEETIDSRINQTYNQYRYVLASRILWGSKIRNLSITLAERAIVKSIKYHATDSVIMLTRLLVNHYGVSELNKYKLDKYLAIEEKYLIIQKWEVKSENYFIDLLSTHLSSFAPPSEITINKAQKYFEELEKVNDIHTYSFSLNKFRVKAAYFEYIKDYNSLLYLTNNFLNEIDPLFKSSFLVQIVGTRKAWALIQAGRNAEAISDGLKNLKRMPYGSLGWYFIAHYTLKAQLYNGDFKSAIDLITQMIDNPKFNKLGANYKELFTTTLGYIHLIVNSGAAGDPKKLSPSLPSFRLGKFLNATPVFSKDKRGINVSILLMHIAFLLQRKDYDAIIDRVDSLHYYAYRHLRKDDTFRSNCMIKMVIQMAKADFHPVRTARYNEKLKAQLKEVKLAGSGQNIETEIIPYEVLWEIMMKSLSNKKERF